MKNVTNGSIRILGSLASADGVGVVRIEERFDADIGSGPRRPRPR